MKRKVITGILLIIFSLSFVNCSSKRTVSVNTTKSTKLTSVTTSKPLPPGQAKKISGDQSAKRHAPGHNKN